MQVFLNAGLAEDAWSFTATSCLQTHLNNAGLKGTFYAFCIYIYIYIYMCIRKILKVKKKMAKVHAYRSSSLRKHCSWNISSVVLPLILWHGDITLCHHVTHVRINIFAQLLSCCLQCWVRHVWADQSEQTGYLEGGLQETGAKKRAYQREGTYSAAVLEKMTPEMFNQRGNKFTCLMSQVWSGRFCTFAHRNVEARGSTGRSQKPSGPGMPFCLWGCITDRYIYSLTI